MIQSFFQALTASKIPSLLLIFGIFAFGGYLVKGEAALTPASVVGICLILVGTTLAIFSFADYRKREEFEQITKSYSTALQNIGKTHSSIEKTFRSTVQPDSTVSGYSVKTEVKTMDA